MKFEILEKIYHENVPNDIKQSLFKYLTDTQPVYGASVDVDYTPLINQSHDLFGYSKDVIEICILYLMNTDRLRLTSHESALLDLGFESFDDSLDDRVFRRYFGASVIGDWLHQYTFNYSHRHGKDSDGCDYDVTWYTFFKYTRLNADRMKQVYAEDQDHQSKFKYYNIEPIKGKFNPKYYRECMDIFVDMDKRLSELQVVQKEYGIIPYNQFKGGGEEGLFSPFRA